MSIFKLSGNMALGSNNYGQQDLSDIKNSLRLLKAKQANKKNYDIPDNNYQGYNYNNQYQSSNTDPSQRKSKPQNYTNQYTNQYNYADISKNHLPSGYGHSSSTAPQVNKYRNSGQSSYLNSNNYDNNKYGANNKYSQNSKYTGDVIDRQRTNSYSYQSKSQASNYGNYDSNNNNINNRGNINKYQQMAYQKAYQKGQNVRIRGRGNTYDPDQFISNVKGNSNTNINTNSYNGFNQIKNYNQSNENKYKNNQYNNYQNTRKTESKPNNIPLKKKQPEYRQYNQPKQYKEQYKQQYKQPAKYNQPSYKNQLQQKSIKQVNRENHVDIVQYDPKQFVKCKMGCGRTFNPQSIDKHQSICKNVFQKKRKQFDSSEHRINDDEQAKYVHQAQRQIKKTIANVNSNKPNKPNNKNSKIPKWKAQSQAFRAVLKQNRNQGLSKEQQKMLQNIKAQQQDSMIKCPYCGRTFNEQAGNKHISFCQQQAKKKNIKKK